MGIIMGFGFDRAITVSEALICQGDGRSEEKAKGDAITMIQQLFDRMAPARLPITKNAAGVRDGCQ